MNAQLKQEGLFDRSVLGKRCSTEEKGADMSKMKHRVEQKARPPSDLSNASILGFRLCLGLSSLSRNSLP